jgi:glycosyltransferase involved in cell wall biosynthesis
VSVAVIIPTFDRAHLIGETLDSLLAQTHAPAEVIVVDDGSTDDTAAVVLRYGGRMRYHRVESGAGNIGPSAAKNIGVSLATSPWIAFCDSDDIWMPSKLERQLRIHALCPEVEISYTDSVFFGPGRGHDSTLFARPPAGYWEPGRRIIEETMWVYEESFVERGVRYQPALVSTLLMSRQRFERLGHYNERFSIGLSEDLEFALRNFGHPPIGVLAEPRVGIRRHESNRSRDVYGLWMSQVRIFEYVLREHAAAQPCKAVIQEEVERKRALALARAFTAGELDAVRALAPAVEARFRDWKLTLKIIVAKLPMPIARLAQRFLVGLNRHLAKLP